MELEYIHQLGIKMNEAQKKQIYFAIGITCLVIAVIIFLKWQKSKKDSQASKEFVDFVQNGTTSTGSIEYPQTRDLSGFDQGDKLTYKGHQFSADVAGGKWVLIS